MTLAWLTDTITSDLDRALHYTGLWGLEGIELHTMGGPTRVVPNVDEEKLERRLMEYEVALAAVVPGLFEGPVSERVVWLNEVAMLPETMGFCDRVGCTRVVVSAFAEEEDVDREAAVGALRRAGDAAARHGVSLAVLNQPGMTCTRGEELAALLGTVDHPAVRAAWDPATALASGERPAAGLEAVAPYVALVRCRDGVARDGIWTPQPLNEGEVGWAEQIRLLAAHGYDGPLSLVPDVEPLPRYGLRSATRLIQLERSASD